MELCERLNIPLTVAHESGKNMQRNVVYRAKAGRILGYHHLGETAGRSINARRSLSHIMKMMMRRRCLNLFREADLPDFQDPASAGEYYQPLLCVSRKEIEEYLNEQELPGAKTPQIRKMTTSEQDPK